jgi:two-component system, sensor histidine kinase PdtaS
LFVNSLSCSLYTNSAFFYREMFKNSLFLCLFVCFSFIGNAKHSKSRIDSLQTLLSVCPQDTNEVLLLSELCEAYEISSPATALGYGNSGLTLAKSLKFKRGIALCNHKIGLIYYQMGRYNNALSYYFQSLKVNEEIGNKKGIADNYNNIGTVYRTQKKFDIALSFLYKALKLDEESGDKPAIASSNTNIGNIYYDAGNDKKALSYYQNALKVFESVGDKKNIATVKNNIGAIYYDQGDLNKAMSNFRSAMEIYAGIGDVFGQAMGLNNLGQIEFDREKYNEAYVYFNKSLKLALNCGARDIERYCYESLAETAGKLGNYKSAFEYKKRYSDLRDSLTSIDTESHINEMAIKYETEKKEQENVKLKNETTKQQFLNEKQKRTLNYLIGTLFLISMVGLAFFLRGRSREKANKHLEEIVAQRTLDLKIKNKEKEIMLKEIHHRVKNNLQLISSILRLQAHYKGNKDVDEILGICNDRIKCMAILHDKLYKAEDFSEINTLDYFSELTNYVSDNYNDDRISATINLDVMPVSLHINQLIPCGLILNELVSNAYKYAFKNGASDSSINISFTRTNDGGFYELKIKDNGSGFPEKFDHHSGGGLGLSIVKSLVEQLDGTIRFENNKGTMVGISFPPLNVQV